MASLPVEKISELKERLSSHLEATVSAMVRMRSNPNEVGSAAVEKAGSAANEMDPVPNELSKPSATASARVRISTNPNEVVPGPVEKAGSDANEMDSVPKATTSTQRQTASGQVEVTPDALEMATEYGVTPLETDTDNATDNATDIATEAPTVTSASSRFGEALGALPLNIFTFACLFSFGTICVGVGCGVDDPWFYTLLGSGIILYALSICPLYLALRISYEKRKRWIPNQQEPEEDVVEMQTLDNTSSILPSPPPTSSVSLPRPLPSPPTSAPPMRKPPGRFGSFLGKFGFPTSEYSECSQEPRNSITSSEGRQSSKAGKEPSVSLSSSIAAISTKSPLPQSEPASSGQEESATSPGSEGPANIAAGAGKVCCTHHDHQDCLSCICEQCLNCVCRTCHPHGRSRHSSSDNTEFHSALSKTLPGVALQRITSNKL